jgi:hypothetical protein
MDIKQAMEELKTVCYLGEDGDMAVNCKTKLGAYRKFRQQMREDCGECSELEEMTIENVGYGYVKLATDEDKERFGDSEVEWYVSYSEPGPKETEVFVFQP